MISFCFYGRVSTEDRQDPAASRAWQLANAEKIAAAGGGRIMAVYFDEGVSRSRPWVKRPEAKRLLLDAQRADRGWTGVIVGEPQRAFMGSQYEQVIPRLNHYGVDFLMPGIDGPVDLDNDGHVWQLTITGGLSRSERRVIQQRVRDGLASKARTTPGQHLGGRPPYGYLLADAGPHPNPSKAEDGKRLHRLDPDPVTAAAVTLIFSLHIEGRSYGEIAQRLDSLGYPSPSAHDPRRNPHRAGGAWERSAVRAILTNEKYTGFLVYGKQPATYVLADPQDPNEGYYKVQRRAEVDAVIRSAEPSHPALITTEQFAASQARMVVRGARATRLDRPARHPYVLRSRLTCCICDRPMEGSKNNGKPHYRCRIKGPYAAPVGHPPAIYVRVDRMIASLEAYLSIAFNPDNREQLVADLLAYENGDGAEEATALREEIASAQRALSRHKHLVESDEAADLSVISGWIKEAEARRVMAEHRLNGLLAQPNVSEAEIRSLLAKVPDLGVLLGLATNEERTALYTAMDVRLAFNAGDQSVDVASLAWAYRSVRGGT